MKNPRSTRLAGMALALACALPATAHAAVVYNAIVVKDALGTVLASVSATPDEIAANPFEVFYVPGIAVNPAEYGNFGVVVDDQNNLLELFGIANGGPDFADLAFAGQGVASSYYIQNPALATGAPIDLTQYLDPALQATGDTASFIVASAGSAVPEPLTWAMMVIGFAAIGGAMRRKALVVQTARVTG